MSSRQVLRAEALEVGVTRGSRPLVIVLRLTSRMVSPLVGEVDGAIALLPGSFLDTVISERCADE